MNEAFEVAAIGLQSQQKALEIIANNIANINTPGFRRTDVRFSEMVGAAADPSTPAADLSGAFSLGGVAARGMLALNETGDLEQTRSPMDLAIDGPGFIELLGPGGQAMLWRGGSLSINDDGLLSAGAIPLRAMISAPTDGGHLTIAPDGTVTSTAEGGASTTLGRIMLVRVDDPSMVEAVDGGFYRVTDSGRTEEAVPGENGMGTFAQGALEHSNVELNDSMVQLMIVQRAFAANAQVVQAADQMMALANNLRK